MSRACNTTFRCTRIQDVIAVICMAIIADGAHRIPPDTKIVGGIETTIEKVPYLISLRRNGQFTCGGSLITSQCILTAAHCVYGVPASTLTVNAGSSKLSQTGTIRQVQEHFVSSDFLPSTLDMDVAILRLDSPLPSVQTIPLCSSSPTTNKLVRISGWGITSENERNPPDQVRTAQVRVVSKVSCMLAYAGKAHLTNTMFCATVPGRKDSCSGDSGGPVVYNGQVCGIVSWGFGCGRAQYPGVYTNVASARVSEFIRRITEQNCN